MLTGKIIPRCKCGKAVYSEEKCYEHYQLRRVVEKGRRERVARRHRT